MAAAKFRLGARGSRLSQIQANEIIGLLKKQRPTANIESIIIKTAGDIDQATPLNHFDGAGTFTSQIERSLLGGEIDLAVHSAKDLPSKMTNGLVIGAVPPRGPYNDLLLANGNGNVMQLPSGCAVGTSSPRRRAMLLNLRSDLVTRPLRGNVETRINKLKNGEYDAIILAEAGLQRLGLLESGFIRLPEKSFVPAPGQGSIAVQIRSDDMRAANLLEQINHDRSFRCLEIERALLRRFNAGCDIAFGCLARYINDEIHLTAALLDAEGKRRIEVSGSIASMQADSELVDPAYDRFVSLGALDLIGK